MGWGWGLVERTDALHPLGMVIVAIATVTRVARGCVHAHTALAHPISEELTLVHICGKEGSETSHPKIGKGREAGVAGK